MSDPVHGDGGGSTPPPPSDTKSCPFCGETIKAVAIRCKHCQADLRPGAVPEADFDRGVGRPSAPAPEASPSPAPPASAALVPAPPVTTPAPVPATAGPLVPVAPTAAERARMSEEERQADFEHRFLDFAYRTTEVLNAASVAYALRVPTREAAERLEDMAARDILLRDVDDDGTVFYRLPGRAPKPAAPAAALVPVAPTALANPAAQHSNAVAGLVLNLVFPGVGSLVAGKTLEGVAQLTMFVVGLPLCIILIGLPLVMVSWAWALATGIRAVGEQHHHTA